jgi:DNA-binding transcriptional LysR family regulator
LAGEAFVQFHRKGVRSVFDEVIAVCRRAGFSPRIVNEPDFMATVMTFVESGLGISLVPRCVRTLNRPGVVIRRISPKSARIPLCIIWRKSAQNPVLTAFLEIVRTARPAIRRQMEL